MHDIKLSDFTQEQVDFVIAAIAKRIDSIVDSDADKVIAGKSPEWDALTLFKVQLYNAKRRIKRADKTWGN